MALVSLNMWRYQITWIMESSIVVDCASKYWSTISAEGYWKCIFIVEQGERPHTYVTSITYHETHADLHCWEMKLDLLDKVRLWRPSDIRSTWYSWGFGAVRWSGWSLFVWFERKFIFITEDIHGDNALAWNRIISDTALRSLRKPWLSGVHVKLIRVVWFQ